MRIRNLVLTSLSLAVWSGVPALAQNPFATTTFTFTREFTFPPVGIGTTETMRINVVNNAANSTAGTAASCTGSISFAAASGKVIGTATKFTVTSGQIFSADLSFTNSGISGTSHGEILGSVEVTGTIPSKVPCSLVISLETFDSSSGVTHLVLTNPSASSLPVVKTGS